MVTAIIDEVLTAAQKTNPSAQQVCPRSHLLGKARRRGFADKVGFGDHFCIKRVTFASDGGLFIGETRYTTGWPGLIDP